jgi:hypothetical protein
METNSTEFSEQINANQIMLNILRQEFPYLSELPSQIERQEAARTNTPVYETAGAINHYPALVPLDRSENGVIQIDGDDDTKTLNIPLQKLTFIDGINYNEIIDTAYTYFVDTVEDEADNLPDIIGKFIIRTKIPIPTVSGTTTDIHVYYLLQNAFDNLEYLSVFYGREINGQPVLHRITDFKTLEVMLASKEQTYSVIQVFESDVFNKIVRASLNNYALPETLDSISAALAAASDDNSLTPDQRLNMYVKELPRENSRASDWNVQIRFKSGYKPDSPYKRDPVDYLNQSIGTDLPTSLDKATSLEKLRDKFEGKIVLFRSLNDSINRLNVGQFNNVDNDDIEGCRMLFYGRWRPVFNIDILTLYATENNAPLDFPVNNGTGLDLLTLDSDSEQFRAGVAELRVALQTLIDAGTVTVLNEDGINSPIWNSFPHALNALSINEYKDYLKLADVFDVEYLAPYEPRGSVKYYDPVNNGTRGSELFPGNRLVDTNASSPQSLKDTLNLEIDSAITQIEDAILETESVANSLQTQINDLINWKSIADDIVDGENNRFQWRYSDAVGVSRNGQGARQLDNYFIANAAIAGVNLGATILGAILTFGATAAAVAATTEGTVANSRAADQFEFGNPQEQLYKDKINALIPEYEQVLPAALGFRQTGEIKIDQLEALKVEINADTYITAFDNYRNRIDAIGTTEVISTLNGNITSLESIRTRSINAYTHFLGILNREVGQAKTALTQLSPTTPINLRINNFRSSLATSIAIDDNIINNLI